MPPETPHPAPLAPRYVFPNEDILAPMEMAAGALALAADVFALEPDVLYGFDDAAMRYLSDTLHSTRQQLIRAQAAIRENVGPARVLVPDPRVTLEDEIRLWERQRPTPPRA